MGKEGKTYTVKELAAEFGRPYDIVRYTTVHKVGIVLTRGKANQRMITEAEKAKIKAALPPAR